ncbi:unnamed protein product, partial [Strongylus vulgaris]
MELKVNRAFFIREIRDTETIINEKNLGDFSKTILNHTSNNEAYIQALVLTSTRDLAQQVTKEIKEIADIVLIKVHACIGGTSVDDEKFALAQGAHVIVGTPGRVKHMIELGFL